MKSYRLLNPRNGAAGQRRIGQQDSEEPVHEAHVHGERTGAPMSNQRTPSQRLNSETIPIVEEELRLEKREVATGKVRVSTVVDVVEELARASLEEETVEVTRVPIDRVVGEAPAIRTEDGVTIVPVLEEVLVVEKRLVLKEELHIRRHTRSEEVQVPVKLRKQRAVVERLPADEDTFNPDKTGE
jgi:stress response protein YsnF